MIARRLGDRPYTQWIDKVKRMERGGKEIEGV